MRNYVTSWKINNPDYTYILWTDKTIRKFIAKEFPWFINYYDSYPHHIMRVDAFRVFVLYKYGGIYADLDMECYKPIDDLLKEAPLLLFLENPESTSNAIMASIPNHRFWKLCFDRLIATHITSGDITRVWEITGPKFITDSLNQYEYNDYKLYTDQYFFPIPWHTPKKDQSGQSQQYPDSYGAHHWQGTWWQDQPDSWNWLIILLFSIAIFTIVCIIGYWMLWDHR